MSKKKTSSRSPSSPLPRRLFEEMAEADRLLDRQKPMRARQILQELDRQRPNQPPILRLLINACYDTKDMRGYEWAIYRLNRLERNDPDATVGLAGAHLALTRPGLALRTFEYFLKRWPGHPRSADAHQTAAKLRAALLKEIGEIDQSEEEAIEMAAQHDEVRFFLEHGQFQQGKQVAEKLLKRHPNFIPVLNNLTQFHHREGEWQAGIAVSRRVLKIEPENIHALSNLTRLLFLTGDFEAAQAMSQRLIASQEPALERWTKIAEALSMMGDDAGVLALYERAEQAGELEPPNAGPLFLHFVAVALANTGQVEKARLLWQQVLQQEPFFDLSRNNLEDLSRPPGERNGPWAFDFASWVPRKMSNAMIVALSGLAKHKSERSVETAARKVLQQHPELIALSPHMLARGDADTLQFVIHMGQLIETPEMLTALKDFVLGQHGSDSLRMEASQLLSEKDWLPAGTIRLWVKGELCDVLLLNFEITSEPEGGLINPEAMTLSAKAIDALNNGNGEQAQEILERALALDPDAPSLQNNLAWAYEMQGQKRKAIAMMREIHARYPDYFFGIVEVARLAIEDKDLDTAYLLLNKLMQRKRLHVTEYDALCIAQIELHLAKKNEEVARSWFKMWERPNPKNPKLEWFRKRLFSPRRLERLMREMGR
jgi:predicted Zn-dependent protease